MKTKIYMITVAMEQQNRIMDLLDDHNYDKAHKVRDELATNVMTYIIDNIELLSKQEVAELLSIVANVDDYGV